MVSVEVDSRQMAKLMKAVVNIKNGVPKVLAPAINRTLDKGRTEVKREIRKDYVIKAKDIPVRVSGASAGRLAGAVTIQQGMLPLNRFNVRPKGVTKRKPTGGVYAQVKRGGGRVMRGAFWTPVGGPFIRAAGVGRLPIHFLLSIGAPIMATQPTVGPAVSKAMGDTLAKRIDHELKRVLSSGGK